VAFGWFAALVGTPGLDRRRVASAVAEVVSAHYTRGGSDPPSAVAAQINAALRLLLVTALSGWADTPGYLQQAFAGEPTVVSILTDVPAVLQALFEVDVAAGGGRGGGGGGGDGDGGGGGGDGGGDGGGGRAPLPPLAPASWRVLSELIVLAARPTLAAVPDAPERLVASIPAAVATDAAERTGRSCFVLVLSALAGLAKTAPQTFGRQPGGPHAVVTGYLAAVGAPADAGAPSGPPLPVDPIAYPAVACLLAWATATPRPASLLSSEPVGRFVMDKAAAEVDGRLPTSSGCALLLALFTAGCMPVSLEEALAWRAPEGGGVPPPGGAGGGPRAAAARPAPARGGGGGGGGGLWRNSPKPTPRA